jgi:hypothetical protein
MMTRRAFWLAALVAGALALAGSGGHFRSQAAGPDDEDVLPGKDLEEARQQAIRDKFVGWVREHTTNPRVPDHVAKQIDETLAKSNSFRYAIGADLNDTGKPYLAECWDIRLYFFALSPEQAKTFDLGPNSVIQFAPMAKQDARRSATPLVRLENVRFASGTTLNSTAKINGQVTLKGIKAPAGRYVLRLSFRRGNAFVQSYHYLDELPAEGATISFSFTPLKGSDDKEMVSGPMPLYLDLCKMVKKDNTRYETTIYSNTIGVLVDAVPGGN